MYSGYVDVENAINRQYTAFEDSPIFPSRAIVIVSPLDESRRLQSTGVLSARVSEPPESLIDRTNDTEGETRGIADARAGIPRRDRVARDSARARWIRRDRTGHMVVAYWPIRRAPRVQRVMRIELPSLLNREFC